MITQYREFSGSINDLFAMNDIIPTVLKRIMDFTGVLVHVTELRIAILDAVHGRMSTLLVGHSHMAAAMHRIRLALLQTHPSLQMVYSTVEQAYQSCDFIISRVSRDVYITIKFPVTFTSVPFTLYRVRVFPVAVPDGSSHVTILDTSTVAFAYASRIPYYLELPTLPNIVHHTVDIRDMMQTVRHITVPSCVLGLYMKVESIIRKHCSFRLVHNALKPSVIMLDASIVLFTNVSDITRRCVDMPEVTLPGCMQCIYRLPCRCSFSTAHFYVPPMLSKCGPIFSNRTQRPVTHVTNLAVLSHFFSETDLGSLASDTLLRTPVAASLPEFLLYDHNYSDALAAIDKTQFDLAKAVNLSVRKELAYRSIAEYLSHKQSFVDANDDSFLTYFMPSSSYSPLLLVCLTLSTLAILFSVIISIKLRALSVVLCATRSTTAIPTYFNYFHTTPGQFSTTTSSVDNLVTLTYSTWSAKIIIKLSSIGILMFITFLVLYICWSRETARRYRNTPYPRLFILLYTPTQHVYLHFLTLSSDISCYTFTADENKPSLKVIGYVFPCLHLVWPGLKIQDVMIDKSVGIPTTLRLSYTQAKILRAALSSESTFPHSACSESSGSRDHLIAHIPFPIGGLLVPSLYL